MSRSPRSSSASLLPFWTVPGAPYLSTLYVLVRGFSLTHGRILSWWAQIGKNPRSLGVLACKDATQRCNTFDHRARKPSSNTSCSGPCDAILRDGASRSRYTPAPSEDGPHQDAPRPDSSNPRRQTRTLLHVSAMALLRTTLLLLLLQCTIAHVAPTVPHSPAASARRAPAAAVNPKP